MNSISLQSIHVLMSPPGKQFNSISTVSELCTTSPPQGVNAAMNGSEDQAKKKREEEEKKRGVCYIYFCNNSA